MSTVPPRPSERKLRGLPVAAKLALFLAGGVAAFMIVFGVVLGGFLGDTVRDQVRRSAAEAARAASRADLDTWTRHFGTEDQGLTAQQIYDKNAAKSGFDLRMYEQDEERLAQLEWNAGRLARFVDAGSNVLAADVMVFGAAGERRILAASYEGSLEFAPYANRRAVSYGSASALEGLFRAAGVSHDAIRGSAPILDEAGQVVGEFSVYVQASAVHDAIAAFHLKVAYAALVFIVLGTGMAFVLGRVITRPLRMLQEDIRAVARGELDHHTKPHSSDEIGELARTFDHMTRSLQAAQVAEREAAARRHEIAVAAEVVTLFPRRLPDIPGFDLAQLHEETPALGGDYHDVIAMSGGRMGFLSVGASGSGAPAAMVTSMARSFLRVVAAGESDPGVVLRRVNALLSGDLRKGMYVSVLLCVLDPRDGMVRCANAGHAPLMHWQADEGQLHVVHTEGIALGFDKGPVFDQALKVAERQVCKGDRLVLHGPKTQKLAGADGEVLGDRRLAALVKREASHGAREFVVRVEAVLRKFGGRSDLEGVTLLTLGRPG